MHAQHHDADARILLHNLVRGLDAIEAGHCHVHDDDVGAELGRPLHGFAAIGRTDKLLSPATVKSVRRQGDTVTVELIEPGPFAALSEQKPSEVRVDGQAVADERVTFDGGLLQIDLPVVGAREVAIEIVY